MAGERIMLLGVNHKTTPVQIREKMALTGGYQEPLLRVKEVEGCKECYLLSTCNRVELLLVADPGVDVEQAVISELFGEAVPAEKVEEYLYIYYDDDAAHHLFMVSASLDSMVVGEVQIVGQLKEAYRHATGLNCTGALLNKLIHKAFSVAKRVRSETGIGESAVSISYAAVQLAKKIFGNLEEKKVLLIGAGEMAELAAEHLLGQGVAGLVVANRTLSRAVDLAGRLKGKAVSLAELDTQLETVDIIISSTGSADFVLHKDEVKKVMRSRKNEPLFFIDIAVPRDLDPEISEIDNVFLYDIDDLTHVVEMNKSERQKEAAKAQRIVDEETIKFQQWREGMAITPTIRAMRTKMEQICNEELERTLGKMPELEGSERKNIEKMTRAIASKMLHDPLQYLKNNDCEKSNEKKVYNLRNIFNLEDGKGNDT